MICLLILEREEGRERGIGGERNTSTWERNIDCLLPNQGLNLKPRCVPWLGIEPTTVRCMGRCFNQMSHLARAQPIFLIFYKVSQLPVIFTTALGRWKFLSTYNFIFTVWSSFSPELLSHFHNCDSTWLNFPSLSSFFFSTPLIPKLRFKFRIFLRPFQFDFSWPFSGSHFAPQIEYQSII